MGLGGPLLYPGFGRKDRHSWLKRCHELLPFGLALIEEIRKYDSGNMNSGRQLESQFLESRK